VALDTTLAVLRDVLGRINIVLAYSEGIIRDEKNSVDDRAAHTVSYGAYSAIHDALEVIITELEASDGSSSDTGPHFVH
jgi:hypothetical protein